MRLDLQLKWLNYLSDRRSAQNQDGFTLIELLVVIIIIGLLSAIALPSYLNMASRAREAEVQQYVGSLNRAQQTYFLERQEFATHIATLGVGIRTQTENYTYTVDRMNQTAVGNLGQVAAGSSSPLRAYGGVLNPGILVETSESATLSVLCQGKPVALGGVNAPNATSVATFNISTGPTCNAPNFIQVK